MPFSLTDISASEMTYIVSSGALNSTHSLIQSNCIVFAVVLMFRFLAINFYFPYIFHLYYIILLCYIPFLYLCGVSVYLSVFLLYLLRARVPKVHFMGEVHALIHSFHLLTSLCYA